MTNSGAQYKVKFVCHSNRKIRSFSTLRVFFVSLILYLSLKVTDVIEIKAFIGLWYARGYFQWNLVDMERIWNPATSHSVFCATMSKMRFREILKFISFDNKETRPARFKYDK